MSTPQGSDRVAGSPDFGVQHTVPSRDCSAAMDSQENYSGTMMDLMQQMRQLQQEDIVLRRREREHMAFLKWETEFLLEWSRALSQQRKGKRPIEQSSDREAVVLQGRNKVPAPSLQQKGSIICNFCGKKGHKWKECRSHLHLCLGCGGAGHTAIQCPVRRRTVRVSGASPRPLPQQSVVLEPAILQSTMLQPVFQYVPQSYLQQQAVPEASGQNFPRPPLPPQKVMFAQWGHRAGKEPRITEN